MQGNVIYTSFKFQADLYSSTCGRVLQADLKLNVLTFIDDHSLREWTPAFKSSHPTLRTVDVLAVDSMCGLLLR